MCADLALTVVALRAQLGAENVKNINKNNAMQAVR